MNESAPVELLEQAPQMRIAAYVRRVGGNSAAEQAARWIGNSEPLERAVAVRILGQAAIDDPKVLDRLVRLAPVRDEDPEVRRAIADVMGDQSDSDRCTQILLAMLEDEDEAVRIKAIAGLGITLPDPVDPSHPAVAALTVLLDDPDPATRDWVAFTLGTQLEVDSEALRSRFLTMAQTDVDTDETYPAAEAALALARRGDDRIVPVIAERLTKDRVGTLWLEAAAALAAPDLIAPLEALRARETDDNNEWDRDLAAALESCRGPQPIEQ